MKILLFLALCTLTCFADGIPISGLLTDADGQPAASADFGAEWSNRSGRLLPLQSWKSGADGHFRGQVQWLHRPMVFLAMDAARRNGAMRVVEEKDLKAPMTMDLKLGPMGDVSGSVACGVLGADLGTTTVVIDAKPSGARVARLTLTDGRFTLPLPPGDYEIGAVGYDTREYRKAFVVGAEAKPVDLGKIELEASEVAKRWGKAPPALAVTAARGVGAGVKLSDYEGKWVLVVFWNAAADDATRVLFPRLKELLARRRDDAAKFAILTVYDPAVKTWEEYEAKVSKVKAGPWGGEDLPFPVLLDSSGETWKAWGIEGLPVSVLLDPEGHIVKGGNDRVLEEKLSGK
ncbi:MAG: redoxin domain-containing protein [Planctomycetes bacterium]|nr:redoxin domain-containing protein [Planctomycetota bacterium]